MNDRRVEFYKDILRSSVEIKKKILENEQTDVYERNNIYLLGFMGLLREGYPYETQKEEISESIQEDNPDETFTETTITLVIDNNGYKCTFSRLEEMFGSEFRNLVEGESNYHDSLFGGEEDNEFVMPEIQFTEKEDYGLDDKDDDTPLDLTLLPMIKNDPQYPDDQPMKKSYDTFLANSHVVEVIPPGHKPITYNFFVYPLHMYTEDALICEIAVGLITSDMRYRSSMSASSEDKSKNVTIKIDDIEFMIRGSWKNGAFLSKINEISNEKDYKVNIKKGIHIEPSRRTSSFYMRIKSERDEILNIFPLGLLRNNEETGIAPCIAVLEDGKSRTLISQDSEGKMPLWFGGSQVEALLYWTGNDLTCDINETSNKQFFS